ncbi:MAG: hypothetical protein KDA91_09745 [Planctomycetaceae bacterium]|nr:hypothetical protein [Planctomycetaceae bacterium]
MSILQRTVHLASSVTVLFSTPALVVLALTFLTTSEGVRADESDEGIRNAELAATVKQIFRSRCFECHGTDRREADLNVLERDSLVGEGRPVYPFDLNDSVLYDYVASDDEDFRMPESPRPALSKSEIESIRKWIEAGAPEFPEDVAAPTESATDPALSPYAGVEHVLTSIVEFVEATPRDDRRFLRFFSCNHLLTSGVTAKELETNRQALAKAINHLSWQPDIVQPKVVDGETASVFAVDIRKLGWHLSPFEKNAANVRNGSESYNFFDLVLLEYPYGIAFENSEIFDRLRDIYIQPAGLVRPIPFVRIDWFVSTATQSPLYEDLLQLPHHLSDLEQLIGVDSESNVESYIARRAGMTLSGVSRNNRVVERHPARNGAYWKSYDFQTSKGQQNMFADPINFHFAGGEMIWNLPNGLQAYLVTDSAGNRLLEAPTSIVTDKFAEDKVVRNGLACMRCHERGMKKFADNVRPAFEHLPDAFGFSKSEILKLYAPKDEMAELLSRDEKRFLNAMEMALGQPQGDEPLVPVSRQFLEAPLSLSQAAAELGLRDAAGLQTVFRLPQFTQLGLAGLSGGSVIRRDTWEDHYDQVARHMGLGIPISPVDGNTRPDQLADKFAAGLLVQTNKRSNIFSPGDEMFITIVNETGHDQFIELIGTSSRGRRVSLTNGVIPLPRKATFRFPEKGTITIKPQLGAEFITVFANPERFEPGLILRGDNLQDRLVHDFFLLDHNSSEILNVPDQLVKKTLKIETR